MNILLTGAFSGLGLAILETLIKSRLESSLRHKIFALDKGGIELIINGNSIVWESPFFDNIEFLSNLDITNVDDIGVLRDLTVKIDVFINCAGVNHIDYLENMSCENWDKVMNVNAKGIFNMSKLFLDICSANNPTILNIISDASHRPMTSSIAYNASKAAAHMMTLQMARELFKTHGITVFGISPNKLKGTGMSNYIDQNVCETRGWTQEEAKEYQLKGLARGEETDPYQLAKFIEYLLIDFNNYKYFHGCVIPYGA